MPSRSLGIDEVFALVQVCQHRLHCSDCCWLWQGRISKHGYGQVRYEGAYRQAHRLIYELRHKVRLTVIEHICHHCDNPGCCNWNHLFKGSAADNRRDAQRKGRLPRGSQQSQAKMTEEKVIKARQLYKTGEYTQYKLAQMFSISESVMQRILVKEDWSHA